MKNKFSIAKCKKRLTPSQQYITLILYPQGVCQGKKAVTKEIIMINETVKKQAATRLKRIEGQVRGIGRMVEEAHYCIDIINQITAAQKALDGVAKIVMKRHVESCVTESIRRNGGEKMIDELIQTVFRYGRTGTR